MTRIAILLSGRWDERVAAAVAESDVVLCAPGNRPECDDVPWLDLPHAPDGLEGDLTDALVAACGIGANSVATSLVECFLNDYFSYTLRPAAGILCGLSSYLGELNPSEVVVITARTTGSMLPMSGIRTSESSRGSRHLLGARVARLLPMVFPDVHFRFHYAKGDPLCCEGVRRALVAASNAVFGALLIRRTLSLHRTAGRGSRTAGCGTLALVRTLHQSRFMHRLLPTGADVSVVVFPQATQGKLRSLTVIQRGLSEIVPVIGLGSSDVAHAVCSTLSDITALRRYAHQSSGVSIPLGGLRLPLHLGHLANEITLVSVLLLYKNLVSRLLRRLQPQRLVSLELVGRMAGLEALAARLNGVESCAVQTALVSGVPHPVFPSVGTFYADSATSAELIRDNGSKSLGSVVYAGPPYEVSTVRRSARIGRMAFFTQPVEHEVTVEILGALCRCAKEVGATVALRLHPRDTGDYQALLREHADVLYLESRLSLPESVQSVDLCVTRTSSVAKEALALGSPVMLCLWSAFDRRTIADYIAPEVREEYCAASESEIKMLLSRPDVLMSSAEYLQRRMFGDKRLPDLAEALFGGQLGGSRGGARP